MLYQYLDKTPQMPQPFDGFIAPNASVIGDVYLGHQASVWFGAVIRGDNAHIHIGDGTNIQENSVIHTDAGLEVRIGNQVTVGHMVMLHGCQIGDNSLIGMGSVILNRAKIGKNCLIGAGSLVTEGKEIPDNSLVMGSPAKVVKTLTEEQIAQLKLSAQHYVEKSRSFCQHLMPIE